MNPDKTFALINLPPSTSRPNDMRGIDKARDNIYSIFGNNAILVPAPADIAKKMCVPCPAMTVEQTRLVPHQVRLTRENIAVACAGSGLSAIFFATDAVRENFLKDNPLLRASLLTSGPLGTVLWLRCPDPLPVTVSVPGSLCWIGAGEAVVVAGRGGLAAAFKILNLAKPVELLAAKIVWPEPMRVEVILNAVARTHGATRDPRPAEPAHPQLGFLGAVFRLDPRPAL